MENVTDALILLLIHCLRGCNSCSGLVWAIQRKKQRWSARRLLRALIVIDVLFLLVLAIMFCRLLSLPLG
jgi:hypothetical protein